METTIANKQDLVEKASVIERYSKHVSSGKVAFFKQAGIDFVLGRREGPYLWDLPGEKKLIDCHCNGGVFNLGHRNPEIITTLIDNLSELDIGNHHLISKHRAALAAKLADLSPDGLTYTVFGVSGGEAVDLAIKVARGATGRTTIISAKGGYHGHTGLALAAGDPKYRDPFGSALPGFLQVPFNDTTALAEAMNEETAAVILETIPATYGILLPESGYLQEVRTLCDQNGALLIADEVQTGLGRTGRLWGIEHFDVEPDILVTGKGLSGGIYPITATCFKAELESVFHRDPFIHISTFGGAEVGCVVALKVLEIVSSDPFLRHVSHLAGLFRQGFDRLTTRHPHVLVGLRQLGLMMGVELADPALGPVFTRAAYECGFLSVYANNEPSVAQLLPPLTIEQHLAEEIIDRVDRTLEIVSAFVSG